MRLRPPSPRAGGIAAAAVVIALSGLGLGPLAGVAMARAAQSAGTLQVSAPSLLAAGTSSLSSTSHVTPPPKRPHPHGTPPPKRPHPKRKPWPVTVTVQTVPSLANLRFSWDGKVIVTDAGGRASVTAEHNFAQHALAILDTSVNAPGKHYRFVRWAGQRDPQQAFRRDVTGLPMRANYAVTAGFSVQYPVTGQFIDEHSMPVEVSRISTVTVRNDLGKVIDFPRSGTIWLDGTVPLFGGAGLNTRDASYSLQSVMVSGTNTVDVGQQTFHPAQEQKPVFTTKFFDLTVTAHDLLFKAATGKAAQVTFPDGTVHTVPFGPDGSGTLVNLPRGVYQVDVHGAGTAIPAQVTLSRTASVDVVVATRRDLATLGSAGLGVAVGLLLLGRGRRGFLGALVGSAWSRVTGRRRRSPRRGLEVRA